MKGPDHSPFHFIEMRNMKLLKVFLHFPILTKILAKLGEHSQEKLGQGISCLVEIKGGYDLTFLIILINVENQPLAPSEDGADDGDDAGGDDDSDDDGGADGGDDVDDDAGDDAGNDADDDAGEDGGQDGGDDGN